MSVYNLSTRIGSVEYSVDELGRKADSFNAVFAGTTTVNGLAFLNGPVAFGNSFTGLEISDVKDLQTALDAKAIQSTTNTKTGKCFFEREGSVSKFDLHRHRQWNH